MKSKWHFSKVWGIPWECHGSNSRVCSFSLSGSSLIGCTLLSFYHQPHYKRGHSASDERFRSQLVSSSSSSQHDVPLYCTPFLLVVLTHCFPFPVPHTAPSLRCLFGTTVSCIQSGGGPIRKCACSCLTWRGRTPPSALCPQSWPRKWLMRPSYEYRVVPRGALRNSSSETLSKKKNKTKKQRRTESVILMNFCTSCGPLGEERAALFSSFLLLRHLI